MRRTEQVPGKGWAASARALGVLALVALLAAALAPVAARADGSRMTGRVLDADTRAPIAGAEVELANASGGQGYFRARSDAKGEFAIDGIPADRYYTLTVGADGYVDFVLGGWQFPSMQRAVDLAVPLDRAGVLEVRLTTSDGRTPVAGARVAVASERGARWWEGFRPPPAPVFTGADGAARFPGLAAGFWTVTADASGLRPAEVRRVTVRRGETTPVPVALVRPAGLSGRVQLADGTGVPGVAVTARGPGEAVATTGLDGEFTVGELEPGKYRLAVASEGFEPFTSRDSYTLAEGGAQDGIALTVTPLAPEISFTLAREAFVPDAPVKVGLRSFRVGVVGLTVFSIPNAILVDPATDFRRYAAGPDTSGLTRVEYLKHETPPGPAWSWREEEVEVPGPLEPGAYLLRARAGQLERRVIFFVTDLGLLVKRSPTQLLISAGTLRTNQPVSRAGIYLFPGVGPTPPSQLSWAGAVAGTRGPAFVTDDGGLAVAPAPRGSDPVRVVAVSPQSGVSVVDVPLAPAAERGGDQAFLYTDRPIYRPGQTVYWKLFARTAAPGGYALPAAASASLTVAGPDGSQLPAPPAAQLSAHGSADGALVLPADLPLGDWTLTANAARAVAHATFAVQEYRKPEFKVDVTPDREVYVNGDEVRFKIAAAYFFGSPVVGGAVRYNLFESRLRPSEDWDEEETGEEDAPGAGYGRVLKTGETRTDVDGRAEVVLVPERVAYDRKLTLEVEVVDGAGRSVSGRGEATVGRGLFAITLRPAARVLAAGSPIPVEVRTRDHVGRPLSAAVTVELDQEAWNPLDRRYTRSTRPLASALVTTDSLGRAQVSLSPAPARAGQILVDARAEDAKGNRITAETSVWLWDERYADLAYRYPLLEALPDRERYAPGDTARILVNTSVRGAVLLATLEGRELYERRTVRLRGGTGLVSFALKPEYGASAYVAIHVRKGREIHSRTLELPIEGARHDLAITLTPDHDRYRPGDAARIAVQTRDAAGAPVAAEVSVGVVDEAIYSLRADDTPDPHDVFYGRQPNWVTTVVAFPALYLGGASKGGREEVRKDFRDLALWAPAVETDATGRAEVSLTWPDNLTTWRATSRGLTDATLVGRVVAKTLVTKDVVARLAVPRFLVAGDEADLVSVVTNRTPEPQLGVEQSIAADGPVALVGSTSTRADLPAAGEARSLWRVRVPPELPARGDSLAPARFTFRARAKTDSDALELAVPERPRAVPEPVAGGGRADAATAAVLVSLPGDLIPAASSLALDLSPSPAALALSAVDFLVSCPYACSEQTANAVLPAAALVEALQKADAVAPGWKHPDARFAPFLERLAGLQNPDGGWGWWKESESDPYLTVLALDALARAVRLGVLTPNADGALGRGVARLERTLDEVRSLDGEAYALAHLAALLQVPDAGQRFPAVKERLEELALAVFTGRQELGTAGLALAARAHADLGHADEARQLLALLLARAKSDAGGLHWPPDPDAENQWFGVEEENTAYALSALVAVDPGDARAAAALRWLAARRRGFSWRSTRVTGPVVDALAGYLASRPEELRSSYRLRVEWNGESVLDRAVTAADALSGGALRVALAPSKLRPGDNRLALAKDGPGSVYYAWQGTALVPSPGRAAGGERALAVTRQYLRAERTADRRGRPRYLATALAPGEPVRVGESILVRLTLHAARALRYLVIEDPRVAGFEIDQVLPDGTDHPYGTHAEERDDRAVFFLSDVDAGDTVLEYLVRPELDGSFTALPATASGMYDPALLARSGEQRLNVAP